MIISIGYRVKSNKGITFCRWANNVLKGYAINQKRLEYLEKTVKLIDIATRNQDTTNENIKKVLNAINDNKRIAATLFIYFLHFYNILTVDNKNVIDNAALTILITECNPKEKKHHN